MEKLYKSPSINKALNLFIGYHKASHLAKEMKENNLDIFEAKRNLNLIDEQKLKSLLKAENLLELGFRLKDV